jgi:rhodanese-related sulfurtransferase
LCGFFEEQGKRKMTKKKARRKAARSKQSSRLIWVGVAVGIAVIAMAAGAILLQDKSDNNATASANHSGDVSVQEAAQRRDQGSYILDVREPQEWAEYHIPDSTLIPLEELPGRLSEIPQGREIIVVCRTGNRSAQARDILLAAGYTHVTSMTGGLTQWRAQGYPTVAGP